MTAARYALPTGPVTLGASGLLVAAHSPKKEVPISILASHALRWLVVLEPRDGSADGIAPRLWLCELDEPVPPTPRVIASVEELYAALITRMDARGDAPDTPHHEGKSYE